MTTGRPAQHRLKSTSRRRTSRFPMRRRKRRRRRGPSRRRKRPRRRQTTLGTRWRTSIWLRLRLFMVPPDDFSEAGQPDVRRETAQTRKATVVRLLTGSLDPSRRRPTSTLVSLFLSRRAASIPVWPLKTLDDRASVIDGGASSRSASSLSQAIRHRRPPFTRPSNVLSSIIKFVTPFVARTSSCRARADVRPRPQTVSLFLSRCPRRARQSLQSGSQSQALPHRATPTRLTSEATRSLPWPRRVVILQPRPPPLP